MKLLGSMSSATVYRTGEGVHVQGFTRFGQMSMQIIFGALGCDVKQVRFPRTPTCGSIQTQDRAIGVVRVAGGAGRCRTGAENGSPRRATREGQLGTTDYLCSCVVLGACVSSCHRSPSPARSRSWDRVATRRPCRLAKADLSCYVLQRLL
jgi:hypothetical protein